MPGPPPKPTMLKILQGNPGKRDLNKREPQPECVENPPPPAHMLALAKEKWRELAPQLSRLRLLTKVDLDLLENYCDAYAKKRAADEFLKKHGVSYGKKVRRQYPQVAVSERCGALMMAIGDRLGLNPSARSRIQIPDGERPQSGVAARLLGD